MSHWTFSASTGLLLFMGIIWLVVGGLSWTHWRRHRGRMTAAMETLRWLIVTLILVTLAQPEHVRRLIRTEKPEIVVLHDQSGSMQTRDVALEDSNVVSRAQWLESVLATNFWQIWQPQVEPIVEAFGRSSSSLTNAQLPQAGTDLDQALSALLDQQRYLKAVLLLTDGDWNIGENPLHAAGRLRAQQIPVYTISVGSEIPLPDLVLDPVVAPSYGLLGEQISIPFQVRSFLRKEVRTVVSLEGPQGLLARRELVVPPFGQCQGNLLWMPVSEGDFSLTLNLPVEAQEALDDNNSQTFHMAIRTEQLRVLVIDSLPRWEYRYLRNALARDPGVAVECLLFHPGLSMGQGTNYLDAFPAGPEELSSYDVVFLGDVGVGLEELTKEQTELIRGLVESQGSGLVFLPGRRGRIASLLHTSLEELLPVVLQEDRSTGVAGSLPSSPWLTSSGRRHFLTRLADGQSSNAAVWKSLPGFYWSAAVEKAKPGAEVLAVHPSLRGTRGRMPLLVVRPFGLGEVLFLGIDSAWRWRRGVEDKYHYRFWGQVVRWMAHKRHMAEGVGLRLTYSPEQPQAGDYVYLQATVLDLLDWQTTEQIFAQIQMPSGKTERLELTLVPGGWGVYRGRFRAEEGGGHRVALSGSRPGRDLTAQISVSKVQIEKIGQPANIAILQEISKLTRGNSGSVADLDQFVSRISLLPEAEPAELRFRLWANPWWGASILLLLAIYWTARKAAGML